MDEQGASAGREAKAGKARLHRREITRINEAMARGNQPEICQALLDAARTQGIATVAARAEMERGSLYAALRKTGNPTLGVFLSIISALRLTLAVAPSPADAAKQDSSFIRRRPAPNKGRRDGVAVPRIIGSDRED